MGSIALRQSASTPPGTALSVIDGSNVVSTNALSPEGSGSPGLLSVPSPFGSAFGEAVQMAPGWALKGTEYQAQVSPADSGPNDQPLGSTSSVSPVPSPAAQAFGQAAQLTTAGGGILGPAGVTNAQGAVTGSAFSVELRFVPAGLDNQWVIGRWRAAEEWLITINPNGHVEYHWGSIDQLGSTAITAGEELALEMSWDGSTVRGFVNGTLDWSVASSTAPAAASQGLLLGGSSNPVGDTWDEVRISDIARNTADYTPATSPFTSDSNTGCLYHLDGIPIPASGMASGSAFTAELSYEPAVADLGSGSDIILAEVVDVSTGLAQWQIELAPGGVLQAGIRDDTGTWHEAPTATLSAGVPYAIALVWTGSELLLFVNGTQVGSSVAVSSVDFAFSPQVVVAQALGSPASGIVDEVRTSSVARYSTSYTPASGPFLADTDTTALWHLDGAVRTVTLSFGAVPVGRAWTGSVVIVNTAPTTTWQLQIGGAAWGAITGSGPYGPVQALQGEEVTLTATAKQIAQDPASPVIAWFNGANKDIAEASHEVFPISPSGLIASA